MSTTKKAPCYKVKDKDQNTRDRDLGLPQLFFASVTQIRLQDAYVSSLEMYFMNFYGLAHRNSAFYRIFSTKLEMNVIEAGRAKE